MVLAYGPRRPPYKSGRGGAGEVEDENKQQFGKALF